MKQIKRSVFVLCTMAVAATGLWACSNSDESQVIEKETTTMHYKDVKKLSVGELHNQALAYVYATRVKNFTNESFEEKQASVFDGGWKFLENYYAKDRNFDSKFNYAVYEESFKNIEIGELSVRVKVEIDKFFKYVESVPYDEYFGQTVFSETRRLLKNPPKDLNKTDLILWESTVDLTGHSALYWSSNAVLWANDGITVNWDFLKRLWKKIKPVVIADGKGFVRGFLRGLDGGFRSGVKTGLISGVGSSLGAACDNYLAPPSEEINHDEVH